MLLVLLSSDIIVLPAECFPTYNYVKICLPKRICFPKSKIKVMVILSSQKACHVLSISDKVKFSNLLEGHMSLVEVGWRCGENDSRIKMKSMD